MKIYHEEKTAYFNTGITKEYNFRVKQLKKLDDTISKYEDEILEALFKDLHKPEFEAYTSEIAIVKQEINHALKNLKSWMREEKVKTPLYLQPATSYIYKQPKGVVFILSPWNYPFQLAMAPLVGAIAAGNCAIVKPSHKTIHTEKIIAKIINEAFSKEYISVLEGPGSQVVDPVLDTVRFDHIFFTGSQNVGKHIMKRAAENLTPVTLELGGKSPAIVFADADLDVAAKRITWGKFYNAGQTCVGVDYLLVEESIVADLIEKIIKNIDKYYGRNGFKNIAKIIDEQALERLESYLVGQNIIYGGKVKRKQQLIQPTLLNIKDIESPVMKEEIFGPILPIITFKTMDDVKRIITNHPNPLALYVYTNDEKKSDDLIDNVQFGGGAVNHNIIQLLNSNLPFGGINQSGLGHYHAKYSFDTFSHEKSIIKASKLDANVIYPPYRKSKLKLARKLMK